MRRIAFCLAIGSLACAGTAQMPTTPPGAPDPARVTPGTYTVDPAHSEVLWTVNHLGFSEYTGQFISPTGTLTIDPAHPDQAKVDITISIANMMTTSKALEEHMKKPEFFDAAKFPEGRFVSTRVAVTGRTATITGNLTLKGVTKPVVLAARFIGAGPSPMSKKTNVGFAATTSIKRSDFGVSYGVPIISDEVKLVINAAFEAR